MRKIALISFLAFGLFSCKYFKKDADNLLVTVHGEKLYYSDIQHLISPNISSEDSLLLVRSLSEKWAKEQLKAENLKNIV